MDCSRHWTALLLCVAYMQGTQTRKETPRDSQRLSRAPSAMLLFAPNRVMRWFRSVVTPTLLY